jgi:hypothetical protein
MTLEVTEFIVAASTMRFTAKAFNDNPPPRRWPGPAVSS